MFLRCLKLFGLRFYYYTEVAHAIAPFLNIGVGWVQKFTVGATLHDWAYIYSIPIVYGPFKYILGLQHRHSNVPPLSVYPNMYLLGASNDLSLGAAGIEPTPTDARDQHIRH